MTARYPDSLYRTNIAPGMCASIAMWQLTQMWPYGPKTLRGYIERFPDTINGVFPNPVSEQRFWNIIEQLWGCPLAKYPSGDSLQPLAVPVISGVFGQSIYGCVCLFMRLLWSAQTGVWLYDTVGCRWQDVPRPDEYRMQQWLKFADIPVVPFVAYDAYFDPATDEIIDAFHVYIVASCPDKVVVLNSNDPAPRESSRLCVYVVYPDDGNN